MSETFFDVSTFAYAHRGLWRGATPENSIAAFIAAQAAGVGVELDVRLTADNVPVVFHDAGLERMCGQRELLGRIASADLKDHLLPDGSMIPTLEQVLDIMVLPVLIELKVDGMAGEIASRVANIIADRPQQLAVMSFDEPTVAQLCRLVADRPVGLLAIADNHVEEDIAGKAATARAMGCDYIAPHHSILAKIEAAAGGLPMVTWTVRTAEELALARKYGAAPIFEGFSADLAKPAGTPI
ncbi:MAG: glycerophosphodiester phosphodiesterase family protein [Hyphomonadaceae bacterium]